MLNLLRFVETAAANARFGGSGASDISATCWSFDKTARRMSHRRTTQRITFIGPLPKSMSEAVTNPAARSKPYQFLYEDGEIRYPFVVHWRSIGRANGGLCIDYLRSTWLEANQGVGRAVKVADQYGAWQRVDRAAVDALLCWPSSFTANAPLIVEVEGGWSNGRWLRYLRRTWHATGIPDFSAIQSKEVPQLPHADEPAATAWAFCESPSLSAAGDLAGIEPTNHGFDYLPAHLPLTGFEEERPYLKRGDGEAVIFPTRLDRKPSANGKSPNNPYYRYADDRAFFEFNGTLLPAFWEFETNALEGIGIRSTKYRRDPALVESCFLHDPARAATIPSLDLWNRLSTALIDGWLIWGGSQHRLKSDANGEEPPVSVGFRRRSSVIVRGGYVGSRYDPGLTLKAWITA